MNTLKDLLENYFGSDKGLAKNTLRLLPELAKRVNTDTAKEIIENEIYDNSFFADVWMAWQDICEVNDTYYNIGYNIVDYLDNYRHDYNRVGEKLCELVVAFVKQEE